jgi:hypothetical protein
MRKMGLFWFAAALLGAALIFAGCESPTSGSNGAAGAPGAVPIVGTVTATNLQAIIDTGVPLLLANANITGAGVVNFGTANVTVAGKLTTGSSSDAVVILTPQANLTFVGDATIELGEVGDYFIGTAEHIEKAAGAFAGNVTSAVGSEADITDVGGVTAVKDLTLETTATPPDWYGYGLTIYVYGTLTVKGNATAPTPASVVAIGDVLIDPGTATTIATLDTTAKVNISKSTIKYAGTTTVGITLPTTALSSPIFDVSGNGGVLKVTGPTEITATVKASNGFVDFAGNVAKATIIGGGRVRFSGTPAFASAASTITAGIIEFQNGFSTASSAPVSLSGDVYIGTGKAITFGHADGKLTLVAGSTVKVGTPGTTTSAQLLSVDSTALLTPTATAKLTATFGAKKLELDTEALTLTSGTLTVATGAELALTTALTVSPSASLVLSGAAGTAGAKISGAGGVKAGATTITGAWEAVGTGDGTLTIASAATGATITAASSATGLKASAAGATITQATGASNNLTIAANTTIALGGAFAAQGGEIVLTGDDTNPAVLTLIGTITGDTSLDTPVAAADIEIENAELDGTNAIAGTTDDGTNNNLGSLIGAASSNTITAGGSGDDVTINAATIITSP